MIKKLMVVSAIVIISFGCTLVPISKGTDSAKNVFGIEGLTLTKTDVPEKGWWPRWIDYYEFTYNDKNVNI